MPFGTDVLSRAHLGRLRTGPPATGVELQRDNLLRGHLGRVALGSGGLIIDGDFCIMAHPLDELFCIVTERDEDFCVVPNVDERFCVVTERDEVFCITTNVEEDVEL